MFAAVVVLVGADAGTAQTMPPLPPPRPSDAAAPASPPAHPAETPRTTPQQDLSPPAVSEPEPCLTQLKAAGFEVEAVEHPAASNELCRIEAPVRLKAVPVPSRPGAMVRLGDQPILACRFADSFGRWLGDLVTPVVAGSLNTELKNVRTGPGFECRNRNGAATGKLSAHAEGLAIDIVGFELANGSTLRIQPKGDAPPNPALTALRTAACGWFTTVLGPGSDAAHADHLHVDVQQHGSSNRYRICQ
ncbi:extensin family protein [Microvirga sp. KLBC 81]|nr:extensin family protein [Microvirga sp. KLBC 81]